jgi:hypothetical protein
MVYPTTRGALAVALLLAATPATLSAQDAVPLDGFWIGGGVGIGFGGVSCTVCSASRDDALSATVRLGTALGSRMLVGFEANGWARNDEEFDFRLGSLSAVIFFYPSARASGTWYIKTGIGAVAYQVSAVNEVPITARGAAGQVEIGRSVGIGSKLVLSPFVNFIGSVGADLKSDNEILTSASITLLQFGVGLTYH